jgi:hypothetical protein
MGTVIAFPESRRYHDCHDGVVRSKPATIIILPVVRIERYGDEPGDGLSDGPPSPGRKRPRASRP